VSSATYLIRSLPGVTVFKSDALTTYDTGVTGPILETWMVLVVTLSSVETCI